ncbi:MAG: hypothetical protein ACTSQO_12505 [Candidatus Helarchaeota archaeon]
MRYKSISMRLKIFYSYKYTLLLIIFPIIGLIFLNLGLNLFPYTNFIDWIYNFGTSIEFVSLLIYFLILILLTYTFKLQTNGIIGLMPEINIEEFKKGNVILPLDIFKEFKDENIINKILDDEGISLEIKNKIKEDLNALIKSKPEEIYNSVSKYFNKYIFEYWHIIAGIIVCIIFLLPYYLSYFIDTTSFISYQGRIALPWTFLYKIIMTIFIGIILFFGSSNIQIFFVFVILLKELTKNPEKKLKRIIKVLKNKYQGKKILKRYLDVPIYQFSIDLFIKNLKLMQYENKIIEGLIDESSGELMGREAKIMPRYIGQTYFSFRNKIRIFGKFLFRIAWCFTLIGVILNIFIIFWNFYISKIPAIEIWFLIGILSTIIGILFFIIPQISIHNYLKKIKRKILDVSTDFKEYLMVAFFASFYLDKSIAISLKPEELQIREPLRDDIKVLEDYNNKLRHAGTWSYDFPKIGELLIGLIVSIVPLIVQYWLNML